MYKEIIETMELAMEEIPFNDFPFKERTEEEATNCWKQVLHDHIDDQVPSTFIVCTTMAGAISKFLQEECIKLKIHGGKKAKRVGKTAVVFGNKSGVYLQKTEKFTINEIWKPDGYTYVLNRVPLLQEIQTEEEHLEHHKTIIAIDRNTTHKNEGVPTVWLDARPDVVWFEDDITESLIWLESNGIQGHGIKLMEKVLDECGEYKAKIILEEEIAKFKRKASARNIYRNTSEEFFKQIGMILVAHKILKKRYGLHTKKKDLIEFIFENITPTWHRKVIEQCSANRDERC